MHKKVYKKPSMENRSFDEKGIAPLAVIGPAAALVGAFVAGRAATKAFDSRGSFYQNKSLRKVENSYE